MTTIAPELANEIENQSRVLNRLREEISKVIVGQRYLLLPFQDETHAPARPFLN